MKCLKRYTWLAAGFLHGVVQEVLFVTLIGLILMFVDANDGHISSSDPVKSLWVHLSLGFPRPALLHIWRYSLLAWRSTAINIL